MAEKLYDNIYLDRLQGLFSRTKRRSYELLNPTAHDTIADIGCGVGRDAIELAKSGAKIIGIDNDENFLNLARQQPKENLEIEFIACEADVIPLEKSSVDKVRFERVLQHIADHDAVLKEVSRILKPGGILQIVDTDYLSLSIFLENEKLERKIIDAYAYQRIPNGHKVRRLPGTLKHNNFTLISAEIHNYIFNEYELAMSVLRFDQMFEDQFTSGNITREEYEVWQNHDKEQFNLSLNSMIFMARKG